MHRWGRSAALIEKTVSLTLAHEILPLSAGSFNMHIVSAKVRRA